MGQPYICYRLRQPFTVHGFNLQGRFKKGQIPSDILSQYMKSHLLTKIHCDYEHITWLFPDSIPDSIPESSFIKLKYQFQQWEDLCDSISEV